MNLGGVCGGKKVRQWRVKSVGRPQKLVLADILNNQRNQESRKRTITETLTKPSGSTAAAGGRA